MAKQETVESDYTIENGEVILVEKNKTTLSKDDLVNKKMEVFRRQTQLCRQIADAQAESKGIDEAVMKIDKMIMALDSKTSE